VVTSISLVALIYELCLGIRVFVQALRRACLRFIWTFIKQFRALCNPNFPPYFTKLFPLASYSPRDVHVTCSHNIHALFHASFQRSFFFSNRRPNQGLISPTSVLLFYMLYLNDIHDVQLCLQPHLISHREVILCYTLHDRIFLRSHRVAHAKMWHTHSERDVTHSLTHTGLSWNETLPSLVRNCRCIVC
jgi:hypothetical protein